MSGTLPLCTQVTRVPAAACHRPHRPPFAGGTALTGAAPALQRRGRVHHPNPLGELLQPGRDLRRCGGARSRPPPLRAGLVVAAEVDTCRGASVTERTPVIRSPCVAAASSARLRASARAARVASRRPADGSANPKSGSPRRSAPASAIASSSAPNVATLRAADHQRLLRAVAHPHQRGRGGSRARARPTTRASRCRHRPRRGLARRAARGDRGGSSPCGRGRRSARAARPSPRSRRCRASSVATPMPSAETSGVVSVVCAAAGRRRSSGEDDETAEDG